MKYMNWNIKLNEIYQIKWTIWNEKIWNKMKYMPENKIYAGKEQNVYQRI